MHAVQISSLGKSFGSVPVLQGIDLSIEPGEFVALVGPSGCGKSTLLRVISGLEEASEGDIAIGGRSVVELPARERDVAMVFQDYALYPHMTVRENIGFGLKMHGMPSAERAGRVDSAAQLLQLNALLDRKPRNLSGGQRQRVAMGRAIVREPKVFLFDEPLSNLDASLRVEMRTQIKRLHMELRTTSIYVTHDQVEAMTLADRIVVLRGGRIEQVGTPAQLYDAPANTFVAGFVGSPRINLVRARVASGAEGLLAQVPGWVPLPIDAAAAQRVRERGLTELQVGVRAEDLTDADGLRSDASAAVTGEVVLVEPLGSDTMVLVRVGESDLSARVSPRVAVRPGDTLQLHARLSHLHWFDLEGRRC